MSRNNSITFWVTDDYAKTKQDLEQRQDINVLIGDDAPISYYSDIDLALLGHMYFITDLLEDDSIPLAMCLKKWMITAMKCLTRLNQQWIDRVFGDLQALCAEIDISPKETMDVINADITLSGPKSTTAEGVVLAFWTVMTRTTIRQQQPIWDDYTSWGAFGRNKVSEIERLYHKQRGILWRIDIIWNLWKLIFRNGPNDADISSLRHHYKFLLLDFEDSEAKMIELNIWESFLKLRSEQNHASVAVLMEQYPSESLKRALEHLGYASVVVRASL